jgi:hypothetical protein
MCNDFAPEGTTRVVEARPVLCNCVVGQSVELTVAVGVAADPDAVHPASANPPTAKIPSTFSPRRVLQLRRQARFRRCLCSIAEYTLSAPIAHTSLS